MTSSILILPFPSESSVENVDRSSHPHRTNPNVLKASSNERSFNLLEFFDFEIVFSNMFSIDLLLRSDT